MNYSVIISIQLSMYIGEILTTDEVISGAWYSFPLKFYLLSHNLQNLFDGVGIIILG